MTRKPPKTTPATIGRRRLALGVWVTIAMIAGVIAISMLRGRHGANATQPIEPGKLRDYNLLLVTIDTLRADRLGCYGSNRGLTPTIDRLAEEGIRFENVFAHVPLTLPSHASIFTGKYPLTHGVHDNGSFRLGASQTTLATILRRAGYRTAAFVGAFVLDSRFGLDQGFDLYDDYYENDRPVDETPPSAFETLERPAAAVTAAADGWIRGSADRPWFAWVHLYDPHAPYDAPATVQASHPNHPYDAEVAYADEALGEFLRRLDGFTELDRTLVVVTGDHGESLGDHDERTHGVFAYNSTLRVPWLIWARGSLRAQVFSGAVRHVDLLPTVLDLLGLRPPEGLPGQSLRPFLAGERPYRSPPIYFEALNSYFTRNWAPLRGVMEDGYKLIDLPSPELYDLKRDSGEERNIYSSRPELVEELRSKLAALTGGQGAPEPAMLGPDTMERLASLGYVTRPVSERRSTFTAADDPKRRIGFDNLYQEAAERFHRGDAAGAIAILRDLLTKEPRSAEAYQELAYVLRQNGQADEAIAVLEAAIEDGIADVALVGQLGMYLLQRGDLSRSIPLLEDAVGRDPDSLEARNFLGVAYASVERPDEARTQFQAVVAIDASSAVAHSNLGTLALASGRPSEAVTEFETALKYDGSLSGASNGLGAAYSRLGDMDLAVTYWRRAVESDPRQFDALYNLGMALAKQDPPQAVRYLSEFVETAPPEVYGETIREAGRLVNELKSH